MQQFRGIPSAEVALQRALAIFQPQLAEPRFRNRRAIPRGATIVLRDLAATMRELTGAERSLAESILARPTDRKGGTTPLRRATSSGRVRRTSASTGLPARTTHLRSADKKPKNGMPDWIDKARAVMKTVWYKEIVDLGYKQPKPDRRSAVASRREPQLEARHLHPGRREVRALRVLHDRRPQVRMCRSDVSAYCVFDDDFSKKPVSAAPHGVWPR